MTSKRLTSVVMGRRREALRKAPTNKAMTSKEWFRRHFDDTLPYGAWTCADGREVLFNRRYKPILQRWPGMAAVPADAAERVPWVRQRWFYDDGTSFSDRFKACSVALADFNAGLQVSGLRP